MFNILKILEEELNEVIVSIEDEWGNNPRKDYLFHEITGVQKSICVVKKARSKELLELDRWAQTEMRKTSVKNKTSPKRSTISD
tara:strand:+ start:105 stop:356 length:252 start_codon:yes stop_codon:yes gene_type:complete